MTTTGPKTTEQQDTEYKVSSKTNYMDWLVYTLTTMIIITPFFLENWSVLLLFKQISVALMGGFLFGILNHIIRQLQFIKRILRDK